MVILFSDFGYEGPYVGQMKVALGAVAPATDVIDLMHDAPRGRPKPAAYLLAALLPSLPADAVVVAVVDPGVGGARAPVVARLGGRFLVGPDNGLFAMAARQAADAQWWQITWRPPHLSASFHGRDLFAPVAGMLAAGTSIDGLATPIDGPTAGTDWPGDLPEIVYIDRFGNAMTGWRADALGQNPSIVLKNMNIIAARTFSDVATGDAFWYANSCGLVEIAVNDGSAAEAFGLSVGSPVEIHG